MTLEQLVEMLRGEAPPESPATVEMTIKDGCPPQLLERLAKLARMGLLTGDVIMSMVANAPIDPVGLAAQIMLASPAGWTFSALDCSVVRVLARNDAQEVSAAVRIDLLDDSVETLVLNRTRQLVPHGRIETLMLCEHRPPGPWLLVEVQRACDAAIVGAVREGN